MVLSFQEKKKLFVNPFIGCRDIKQTRWLIVMKCLGIQTGKQQNLSVKNENVAQKIAH